jgi:phosphoribosylglycinamide formyltransferase 1
MKGKKAVCSAIILISGNGSNLQAIINAIHNKQLPIKIDAVISTQAAAYGLQRAKEAGLNSHIHSPKDFLTREAYDNELADYIFGYKPDIIVLAGFMSILGNTFLQKFENQIVNIHPSLLPNYPGLNTHTQAIADGICEHGCSIHFVNEDLDGGPIIAQATVSVNKGDTAKTLKQKVHTAEHFLYPTVLNWFAQKRVALDGKQVLLDNIPLPQTGFKLKFK